MKIEENIDLKKYNTYGVGGSAKYFVLARGKQDLIDAYKFANDKNIPFVVLGGGSNVLISDDGYNGLVIVNKVNVLEIKGNKVEVASGINLSRLVKLLTEGGLTGGEFLAGIPGTLGGAILGNAGAWGKAIGDVVESVEFLSSLPCHSERNVVESKNPLKKEKGFLRSSLQEVGLPRPARRGRNDIKTILRKDLDFGYRESSFKKMKGITLGATLNFRKSTKEEVEKKVSEILAERSGKHPVGRSCGSFFKNIETENLSQKTLEKISNWVIGGKIPSGKLIEEAGCKGMKVGGAEVSEAHANFLVNTGVATASDIKELAEQVKKKVFDKFGVELEPEIRYL